MRRALAGASADASKPSGPWGGERDLERRRGLLPGCQSAVGKGPHTPLWGDAGLAAFVELIAPNRAPSTVMAIVVIPCPRCAGHGRLPTWKPNNGVCYRCKGQAMVEIDTDKYMGVLRSLRQEYARWRRCVVRWSATEGPTSPNVRDARVVLAKCKDDGLRVRAVLEAAGIRDFR